MASKDMLFYGETMIKPARSLTHLSTNRMVDNYFRTPTKQVAKFSIKEEKDRMVIVPEIREMNGIVKKVSSLEKIISYVLSDLRILCSNFAPMVTRVRRKAKTKQLSVNLSVNHQSMPNIWLQPPTIP
jgi:hypothetical protein